MESLAQAHLKPGAKKLGLPGVTWHLLRHSHATMLDSVGTPLGTMQSLLGHSTPEITREIYLHAIPDVIDHLNPSFFELQPET
jgi:integrase